MQQDQLSTRRPADCGLIGCSCSPRQLDPEREALAAAYAQAQPSACHDHWRGSDRCDPGKAQASKIAAVAHDGMARAIRPIHSMVDGDTVFCLASSRRPVAEDPMRSLFALQHAAGRGRRRFCRRLPRRDACCDGTRFLEELHRPGALRPSAEI